MFCHDPHAQGACAAVFSGIRLPSPRSSPRPRASCACLHPARRVLIRFRSLSFRFSFRRPRCGGTLIRAYRARARPSAPARFARLIAPARARQTQGARLPWVPGGFFRVGADAEGGAASGCRFLLYHSSMEFSGSRHSGNYYRNLLNLAPIPIHDRWYQRDNNSDTQPSRKRMKLPSLRLGVAAQWPQSEA